MDGEVRFILSSFSFLIWGGLVMWMCAGFTMLEAGSVRTRNASVICLKNIGLYSIAGLAYYLVGYNLMYVGVEEGGWLGTLDLFHGPSDAERALLAGDASAAPAVTERGHAAMSDWFFQMVFVGSTASTVSGTLAERVKLWSFFLFIVVLTAVIYRGHRRLGWSCPGSVDTLKLCAGGGVRWPRLMRRTCRSNGARWWSCARTCPSSTPSSRSC